MPEILISNLSVGRGRSRLIFTAALAGLSMMSDLARSASPDLQSVVGMWNLNLEGTNRTCRVTLRNDPAASNFAIGMPAGCRRAMPDVSPTAGWSRDDNGVSLTDATGAVVLHFSARDDGSLVASTTDGKGYSLIALDGRKLKTSVAAPASPQSGPDKTAIKAAPVSQVPAPSGTPVGQQPVVTTVSPDATKSPPAAGTAQSTPAQLAAALKQTATVATGQSARQPPDAITPAAEPPKQAGPMSPPAESSALKSTVSDANPVKQLTLPTAPDRATGHQATAPAAGTTAAANPQAKQLAPPPTSSPLPSVKQVEPLPVPIPASSIRPVDASSVSMRQSGLGLAPTIVPPVPKPEPVEAPIPSSKKPAGIQATAPMPPQPVGAAAPVAPARKATATVVAAVPPPSSSVQPTLAQPAPAPPPSVRVSVQPPSGQSTSGPTTATDQPGPTQAPVRQVGPTGIKPAPPRPASASNEPSGAPPNWTGAIQPPTPLPMYIAAWSEVSKVIATPDYSAPLTEVPEVDMGPDGQTPQTPTTNGGAPIPGSPALPAGAPMQIVHVVPPNLRPNGPASGLQGATLDATPNNDLTAAMTSAQVAQVSGRYAVWRGKGTGTGCILNLDGKNRGPFGNFRASLSPACRDQGVALLDPSGWTIEHGRIVLTTRNGPASFDRRADGTWSGDAQGLVLTRD